MLMLTNLYSFIFKIPRNPTQVSDMRNNGKYVYRCKLKSDDDDELVFYSLSTLLRSFRARSVNLSTLFLGKVKR